MLTACPHCRCLVWGSEPACSGRGAVGLAPTHDVRRNVLAALLFVGSALVGGCSDTHEWFGSPWNSGSLVDAEVDVEDPGFGDATVPDATVDATLDGPTDATTDAHADADAADALSGD